MLRLRSLTIHKFRHVEPGTHLEFSDGFNVLLGLNGTGKTTLLRLISAILRDRIREAFPNEELEVFFCIEFDLGHVSVEYQQRWDTTAGGLPAGTGELRADVARILMPHSVLTFDSNDAFLGSFIVRTEADKFFANWLSSAEVTEANLPTANGYGTLLLAASFYLPRTPPRHTSTKLAHLPTTHGHIRFQEGIETFNELTGGKASMASPHFDLGVDVVARRAQGDDAQQLPQLFTAVKSDVFPSEWRSALKAYGAEMVDDADIGFPHHSTWLSEASAQLGFSNARASIAHTSTEHARHDSAEYLFYSYSGVTFRFTLPNGDVITHDALSYGQKRLLSFLYYLASNEDIIIADELVNGMHHTWLDFLMEKMSTRQCFLTSQNPLLLDYLTFDSKEEAQHSFVMCESEVKDGRTSWRWRHMSDSEADAFYRAYEVGVQHVSNILRTKGLW